MIVVPVHEHYLPVKHNKRKPTPPSRKQDIASHAPERTPLRDHPILQLTLKLLLLLGLVFTAYWPVMNGEFIWDDDVLLTENPHMHSVQGLIDLWIAPKTQDYFPLTLTFLWGGYQLWGGDNATAFHIANIVLHAMNALFVWLLMHRLRVPGAWLAGVLFAIHPVCVESVAWISEIKNTLSLPFFLLSLYAWIDFYEASKRRKWLSLTCSLVLFILALLAKTSVVTLPVLLLLHAWWRTGKVKWRDFWPTVPFFIVALLFGIFTIYFQYGRAIGNEVLPIGGALSRLAGAGMAVCFYLYKAILPFQLSAVYPRWPINPPEWWTFGFGLLFFGLLAFLWLRRNQAWARAGLVTLGYFLITLGPVLGFLKMSYMRHTLVADHFQYLSLISVAALASAAATIALRSVEGRLRFIIVVGISVVIALFSLHSFRYSEVFRTHETLWTDTLQKNPRAWIAHSNLGGVMLQRGNTEGAAHHIVEARRLAPDVAETHYNYGFFLFKTGRALEAVPEYLAAVELAPDVLRYRIGLINAQISTGQISWSDAVEIYKQCLTVDPRNPYLKNSLGLAQLAIGDVKPALSSCLEAIRLAPHEPTFQNSLAVAYLGSGQIELAIKTFRDVLKMNSDYLPAISALAWTLATQNETQDTREAVELAERAAKITGRRDAAAIDVLAAAYAANGRFTEAKSTLTEAIQLAASTGREDLVVGFRERLTLYEAGRPYREKIVP